MLSVAGASQCPATAASSPASLERLLSSDARQGFSGAVLVRQGSRLQALRAYGRSSLGPVRPDSRFWLASSGKQFVAAAIMKLASEKRLRLDDPLRKFFPDTPSDKAGITLRQLLSHTSGLGQSYVSEEQSERKEAVRRMLAEPLAGPPGSGFRYSNSNIQLAAAVVEVASGMSYPHFVRRKLWQPAGLQSTGFAGDSGAARVEPIKGELPKRLKARYWGEQGVYSTARDLDRWCEALAGGRVLPASAVREMFAPVTKIGEGYAALGWFRGTTKRGTDFLFVRGNEDFGANSLLYAYPARHVVIIVLTHSGDADNDTSWSRKVLEQAEAALGL